MNKLLVAVTALVLSTSAFSAVECAKVNGRLYPVSEQAVKITNHLKISTCSAKIFTAAVEQLGVEMTEVAAPQELIDRLDKEASDRAAARLSGLSL